MTITVTSPITGASMTGLTSPTYFIASDTAPDSNGKQYVVAALGGTQTGVNLHSVSSPFSLTFWRPKFLRMMGRLDSKGYVVNNPTNTYKTITRKGVVPAVNQMPQQMLLSTTMDIPAGADSYDLANIRAAISMHIGALTQQSINLGDLAANGVL